MAIRCNSTGDSLERSANLPSVSLYSVCGWGVINADRNAFQTFWTLENAQFEGIGCDTDGTTFQFFSNANFTNIDTLVVGRWFWWAVVRNGTSYKAFYIPSFGSAVQTFSGTFANITATASFMNAMNDHSRGSSVDGRCAGLKLWDAALSDAEIIQEAYMLRPARTANLNLWTPMIQNSVANAVLDYSGNGRNWTSVSTPAVEQGPPVSWGTNRQFPQPAAATTTTLTASLATFTLTGQAAGLRASRQVVASAAAFTLTGRNASLNYVHALQAAPAAFTLTGQAASLLRASRVAASPAAFTVSAQDAGLRASRQLIASAGAFTLTGISAGLNFNRRLTAQVAAFTLTGVNAGLARALLMPADAASFALSAKDADFDYQQLLQANVAAFILTGRAANLFDNRLLTSAPASFTLTGRNAELIKALQMPAQASSFALAAQDAELRASRVVSALRGVFTLTGRNAVLYEPIPEDSISVDRTYPVGAEGRILSVEADSRGYSIPVESRILSVSAESRVHVVPLPD